jgi:hypothetical protein
MTGPILRKLFFLVLIVLIVGTIFTIIPSGSAATTHTTNYAPTSTLVVNPLSQVMLYSFVDGPTGAVDQPYILLTAFADLPSDVVIQMKGVINENLEFSCSAVPCKLPLTTDSVVRYWAFTNQGHQSEVDSVTARISKTTANQYQVTLQSTSPAFLYQDSCASIWGVFSAQYPNWAQMPATPALLNTNQKLYYLAASLINSGIVDASACTNGGLDNRYSPNGCGMEKAAGAMQEWQNKFDLDIWLTGGSVGLPPKLLKTLIARESQFWPASTRYYLNEYGLAQINDYGADVALRWDPSLYQQLCNGVLADCSTPYNRDSAAVQAMMRGALINQLNPDCPTCKNGINQDVAHSSIYVIARVLHANCWETRFSLDSNKASLKNYEDLWKLTMVSYHSGYYCMDYAVNAAAKTNKALDWASISANLVCQGARQYVDDFWSALTGFDKQVIVPSTYTAANVNTLPTPTAGPTPTPAVTSVRIRVRVYNDTNNDGIAQPTEGINGVSIKLTFSNNETVTGITDQQGMAIFDLKGRTAGEVVIVQLPDLFRRENIILPGTGVVDVLFKFNQPILPTSTP